MENVGKVLLQLLLQSVHFNWFSCPLFRGKGGGGIKAK